MSAKAAPRARYTAVAVILHWLIAVLLIGNIGLAWYFNTLHGLPKIAPTQLHKSIGITILLLSLARLAWRFISPPPPMVVAIPRWQKIAAETVHWLLYVVMIGMPLSGWALSSASALIQHYPITLYGLVEWPAIGPLTTLPKPQMHQAHAVFTETHELLAKLAYLLIVLHVGAALMHQFIQRDGTLARMVPFLRARAA